jgi:uncharacterized membrane protein YvlD (DUF360 family)
MQSNENRSLPILLLRAISLWLINAIGIWLASLILPGVAIIDWRAAFLFVIVIGLLDALLWPLLARLTLRFVVFTLGFFTFLLNGLIFWFGSQLVAGVEFSHLGSAVLAALFSGVFGTLAASLFSIDDNAAFYRNVVERNVRRVARRTATRPFPRRAAAGDRRAFRTDLAPRPGGGRHASAGALAAEWLAPHRRLGDGPLLPDRSSAGRHLARQQRTTSPPFAGWKRRTATAWSAPTGQRIPC